MSPKGSGSFPGLVDGGVPDGGSWPYAGVEVTAYEVSEREVGAKGFDIPLRFPGQYYDAETQKHENWNRYFDPASGRYLSPEPMLQSVDPTGLLYDVPCPPNTSCPENLGNFEPPGGTAGVPQQPQPWDPNALPPLRGAPSGTPIPFESSPMMQACLRKCREGRGRELMERMCAGRVSNPTAFRQCIDNILKQIAWCEEDCRKVMPQQKGAS